MSVHVPEAYQRRDTSTYQAGETHIEIWPNGGSAVGRIPIIWCHGFSLQANPCLIASGGPYAQTFGYIAERTGHPVIVADIGGNAWANTTARTRFTALRTWLAANRGLRGDKFFAAGESMGSTLAAYMAWTNPVACVGYWLRAPIVAFQTFHDANPGGLSASMETAYTNLAGLVAAYPTVDPSVTANRTALSTFGERGRIDWTDADEFIAPSIPQAYAAAVGAIGVQRHGNHEANAYTPVAAVADWVAGVIDAAA
jgi:dienelactone hydrolase